MFLEASTRNFSLLSDEDDTDTILTTKSVGRSANIGWRKNLSKEPDKREMLVCTSSGQIARKIHIDTEYR